MPSKPKKVLFMVYKKIPNYKLVSFSTQTRLRINLRPRVGIFNMTLRPCQDHVIFSKTITCLSRPCFARPIWSNLIQFDQVWSSLIQYDPIWSNLTYIWSYMSKIYKLLMFFIIVQKNKKNNNNKVILRTLEVNSRGQKNLWISTYENFWLIWVTEYLASGRGNVKILKDFHNCNLYKWWIKNNW